MKEEGIKKAPMQGSDNRRTILRRHLWMQMRKTIGDLMSEEEVGLKSHRVARGNRRIEEGVSLFFII